MKKGTVYYDSKGPSGNIYHILGLVRQEMRKQRRITEFNECRDKVFDSQSYEDALAVINEYVDLVDTSKTKASLSRKKRANADLEDDFKQAMAMDLTETEMTYVGEIVFDGGTDYEIRAILATQNVGAMESELTLVEALNLEDDSTAYLIILDGEVEHIEMNKTAAEDFYKSFSEDMDSLLGNLNEYSYNEEEDSLFVNDDKAYEPVDATYDSISAGYEHYDDEYKDEDDEDELPCEAPPPGSLDDAIDEIYDEDTKKAVGIKRVNSDKTLINKRQLVQQIQKWLAKNYGKSFYDDIGQHKTASEEAEYIAENIDIEDVQLNGLDYILESWTDGYLSDEEYDFWKDSPEWKGSNIGRNASRGTFDKKRKKVNSSKRKIDPKGDVQKALSRLKPMVGKDLAETKKVLEKEGFRCLEEEETYGNWVKGNDIFAYLEWDDGKINYIDLVYSDDELGVLYEEDTGSVHASAQTDATYKVGDAIEYEKTLAFEKGTQKIKSKIVAIKGMRGLTAEGDWISILKDLPIRILSSIRGDENALMETKNNIQTESADNAPTDGVYNPGDLVFWKEEWKDAGDDNYNFIVLEDRGERFEYTADPKDQSKRLAIPGTSVATKDMVARRITDTKILGNKKSKSKSILHDVAAEMKGIKPVDFQNIYNEAQRAGIIAAGKKIPTPMVVEKLDGNSKVKKTWQVNEGVCGFAWITIKPANSAFAKWLMEKNLAKKASYGSGVLIWVYQYGQSYERKAAYAGAFAGVLQKYGINAQMGCRED